ncbi:MAG: hypothetical protein ACI8RD_009682, partial [Bacillariaceae sp.]
DDGDNNLFFLSCCCPLPVAVMTLFEGETKAGVCLVGGGVYIDDIILLQ